MVYRSPKAWQPGDLLNSPTLNTYISQQQAALRLLIDTSHARLVNLEGVYSAVTEFSAFTALNSGHDIGVSPPDNTRWLHVGLWNENGRNDPYGYGWARFAYSDWLAIEAVNVGSPLYGSAGRSLRATVDGAGLILIGRLASGNVLVGVRGVVAADMVMRLQFEFVVGEVQQPVTQPLYHVEAFVSDSRYAAWLLSVPANDADLASVMAAGNMSSSFGGLVLPTSADLGYPALAVQYNDLVSIQLGLGPMSLSGWQLPRGPVTIAGEDYYVYINGRRMTGGSSGVSVAAMRVVEVT